MLSVQDSDFFTSGKGTELPLVGVSVPVTDFFFAGSAVVAGLYVYLHLYLEPLWAALGAAPARIDGRPLFERIEPWQISEWALAQRDQQRGAQGDARSAPQRAFSWVGNVMTVISTWLLAPMVIALFWWRSMPAHLEYVTLSIALMFALTLWMATRSWRQARRLLARRTPLQAWPGWGSLASTTAMVAVLVAVSILRTGSEWWPGDWERPRGDLADAGLVEKAQAALDELAHRATWPAHLLEVAVVQRPDDWKSRREAERDYRSHWAEREGIPFRIPFDPQGERDVEVQFQLTWREMRTAYLMKLGRPRFESRNLRRANLELTFLPGALMRWARLERANLYRAELEGADFLAAHLEDSELSGANLSCANLTYARLDRAVLDSTQLSGATLIGAHVSGASMQRPLNLGSAYLRNSVWHRASLRFVDLRDVPMEQLQGFATTFGDASVALPDKVARPCHWSDRVLSDDEFFGHWRGWLEFSGAAPSVIALYGVAGYEAVLPQASCPVEKPEPTFCTP